MVEFKSNFAFDHCWNTERDCQILMHVWSGPIEYGIQIGVEGICSKCHLVYVGSYVEVSFQEYVYLYSRFGVFYDRLPQTIFCTLVILINTMSIVIILYVIAQRGISIVLSLQPSSLKSLLTHIVHIVLEYWQIMITEMYLWSLLFTASQKKVFINIVKVLPYMGLINIIQKMNLVLSV